MALSSSWLISSGIGNTEDGSAAHAMVYPDDVQTRANGYGKTSGDGANMRAQFWGVPHEFQTGEQRVWEGVLLDAVNVLDSMVAGRCPEGWKAQAKKDMRWLQEAGSEVGSFVFVCEAVGIEPGWLRPRLLARYAGLVEQYGRAPADDDRRRAAGRPFKADDRRTTAKEWLESGKFTPGQVAARTQLSLNIVYSMMRKIRAAKAAAREAA